MLDKKNRFSIILLVISSVGFFIIPRFLPLLNNARVLLLQTIIGFFVITVVLFLIKSFFPDKNNLLVLIGLIGTLLLIARLLFYYAGGPISWDELYYMYLSMFPEKESTLLNRYFHIYLQRFFFFLAGWDPLTGAKMFWTFCIITTAGFTFFSAYSLFPSKKESLKIAAGIFSMLVYFTFPYILDYPGVTYVDYTSMVLGSIFIFVYLQARKKPRIVYFILLGLLFFLSIKTKEVGLCLAVFLCDKNLYTQKSKTQNISRSIFYLGIGFISGVFIIALNDYFLLGDFLYSLRFSSWQALLSFNARGRDLYELIDLFGTLTRSGILYLLFFTLYVMHILGKNKHLETAHHFLWIYVVTVLVFHLISTMSGALMIVIRYFVVLCPALAILSVQFVYQFEEKISGKWLLKLLFLVIICFMANFGIRYIANVLGWERGLFLERIFIPMLILASLFLFFQEQSWVLFAQLGLFVLILVSFFPAKLEALHNRDVENAFNRRIQPLVENADALTYSTEMSLFVSSGVYESYEILGRDRESNSWMYALMFRQKVNLNQFVYDEFKFDNFLEETFTSAFLSASDWNSLGMDQKDVIESKYLINETEKYVFLSAR